METVTPETLLDRYADLIAASQQAFADDLTYLAEMVEAANRTDRRKPRAVA